MALSRACRKYEERFLVLVVSTLCMVVFIQVIPQTVPFSRESVEATHHFQQKREVLSITPESVSLPTTPKSQDPIEILQNYRQAHLRSFCEANKEFATRESSKWVYKHSGKQNALYCPVPKSGWSSWKVAFWYAAGLVNTTNTSLPYGSDQKAGWLTVREDRLMKMPKHSYSFAFVRNPWDRLVSAYKDKVLGGNYARRFGRPCMWLKKKKKRVPDLTFTEFLRCIVTKAKRNPLSLDPHWAPQWSLCHFCALDFTYIGHFEHIALESGPVLKQLGMNFPLGKSNGSKQKAKKPLTLAQWYDTVPKNLISDLQNIYKHDFIMHGYSLAIPSG